MLYARARKRDAKRALKDAGKKRRQAERSGDMPAEYRRYSEMEATAKRNVAAAQRDIADIIARAQSEGRSVSELTPEEIEDIDARRAAGAAAANEVRRRAASDF